MPFGLPYWLLVARLAVLLAFWLTFWLGFFALLASLPFATPFCHFERSEKSIFWFYGYFAALSMTSKLCLLGCLTDFWLLGLPCFWLFGLPFGSAFLPCLLACLLPRRFVILSVAKNPYFDFMDTSLRSVWQASCAFWAALLTFGCSACLAFGFLAYLLARLFCLARSARCHFERSEKSIFWFYGYFATLSMTKALNLSFWAFYKKAKNPYFKVQFAL